jgi:hypothetical protein
MNAVVKSVNPVDQVGEAVLFAATPVIGLIGQDAIANISFRAVRVASLADQAMQQAERAEIKDQDSFNSGADLTKIIGTTLKESEADRKTFTAPLDEFKKYVTGLFQNSNAKLEKAKSTITMKMNRWAAEEQRKKQEAARAAAKEAEDRALAMAAAQASIGDDKGADQILDKASTVITKAAAEAKVTATGNFGAAAAARTTISGDVENPSAFLNWLLQPEHNLQDILAVVDFKKSGLNAIAKKAKAAGTTVPGLTIKVSEDWIVR